MLRPDETLPRPDETFSIGRLVTTSYGRLAIALLSVELLTGMQTFLTGTITPLLAADLNGHHLYGVATAAAQVAIFLTMPLGAALLHRFSAAKLLMWLTPVTVLAGILGALSPSMWWYIGTRVLAGLSGGIIATAGMGAIVTGLPASWRRFVLAMNNLMWLISAVVGPGYAAWVSHWLSWRWAMVLYLPFLLLARWVIARQLAKQPTAPEPSDSKLPLGNAIALASGVALLSLTSTGRWWGWMAGGVGLVLIVVPLVRLMPPGVATARPGARAALALLALLSLLVFTTDAVAPILGHDVLGFSGTKIGWLLTSMSLCWSLIGLACGKWPVTGVRLRIRGGLGLLLITAGIGIMTWTLVAHLDWGFIGGFAVLGTGMGLVFLDAMNVAFTLDAHDPLDPRDASAAATLGEQVLGATGMTLATSLISFSPPLGPWVLGGLIVFVLPAFLALWRAGATLR